MQKRGRLTRNTHAEDPTEDGVSVVDERTVCRDVSPTRSWWPLVGRWLSSAALAGGACAWLWTERPRGDAREER